MRKFAFIFLGVIVLFAGLGSFRPALAAVPHIEAVLEAVPANVIAYGPTEIKFTGAIRVSGACPIQYRLVRSDGLVGSPIALGCPAAGIYPVKAIWKLTSSYSGWMMLEVLSPVNVKSRPANFSLTIKPKPVLETDPTIQYLWTNGSLNLIGSNLGNTQGTRNITLDGQPVVPRPGWSILKWTDSQIIVQVKICDLVIWDHTYQLAVTEGGTIISDVYQWRFLYPMDPEGGENQNVIAGQNAIFKVYNLPSTQSGFTFAISPGSGYVGGIWGKAIPIVGWQGAAGCTPGTVTVPIPLDTVLGSHYVFLMKNGTACSYDYCQIVVLPHKKPLPFPIKK